MNKKSNQNDNNLVSEVQSVAEQVRILALNLAINLARAKNSAKELAFLEPDFTKLVYGSVEVIKEITAMLKTFENDETMVYAPPTKSGQLDHIETSLNDILNLSHNILEVIARIKKGQGQVDKYKRPGT